MRASGVRGLLIYCADYQCSHWITVNADHWPDDMRLSDLEDKFTCTVCGTLPTSGRISIGTKTGPRRIDQSGRVRLAQFEVSQPPVSFENSVSPHQIDHRECAAKTPVPEFG
jgi:hypothetical protein